MYDRVKIASKKPKAERFKTTQTQKNRFNNHSSPLDQILFLQRTIGNQAVESLFKSGIIRAKLKIGKPNDIYEQEADRVAEQIVSSSWSVVNNQMEEREIQRQTEEEERKREEEGETLQLKKMQGNIPEVTPDIESRIRALRGSGQPLPKSIRAFFESRFGYDFSHVRIHNDPEAAKLARALNAEAFTYGRDIYFGEGRYNPNTLAGKRLLAHELTHVVQQRSGSVLGQQMTNGLQINFSKDVYEQETSQVVSSIMQSPNFRVTGSISVRDIHGIIQRDLALEPPTGVPEQPELTDEQVQAAIRYNRASYSAESTRLIQDLVGAEQTGEFNEATVRLIARFQQNFGLRADGKAGPQTYNLLIRELRAERVTPTTCLTLFQIVGPRPLRFFRLSPETGMIQSHFRVRIRFDPRCTCRDWEYRQYIAGSVILHDVAGPMFNLNNRFSHLPAGMLTGTWREDGDTTIPANVAGHHYGHRNYAPNPGDGRDRYLPNRRTGCRYEGYDFPELSPIPAAPGDSGDRYQWNMRFRGVIIRRGRGMVEEKYWVIKGTVIIP